MAESATILIPDISGYTEFLTKTELVHSAHIINELLDAILAPNSGEFELSEVEGDALLLYRRPADTMAVGRRAPRPTGDDRANRSPARLHLSRPDRRVGRGQERDR